MVRRTFSTKSIFIVFFLFYGEKTCKPSVPVHIHRTGLAVAVFCDYDLSGVLINFLALSAVGIVSRAVEHYNNVGVLLNGARFSKV